MPMNISVPSEKSLCHCSQTRWIHSYIFTSDLTKKKMNVMLIEKHSNVKTKH